MRYAAGLAAALGFFFGGSAAAQDQLPRDIPPITFKISVALALPQEGQIDPDCLELSRRLPMRFGSLTHCAPRVFRVPFGERAEMELPTGSVVSVLPVQVHRDQLHMQFELPGMVNTRLQMTHGRPVIMGGIKYDGGLLIIQVVPEFAEYIREAQPEIPSGPKVYEINSPSPD